MLPLLKKGCYCYCSCPIELLETQFKWDIFDHVAWALDARLFPPGCLGRNFIFSVFVQVLNFLLLTTSLIYILKFPLINLLPTFISSLCMWPTQQVLFISYLSVGDFPFWDAWISLTSIRMRICEC